MIDNKERESIISLIKREVVPAIGCTEPIAVAFAVAKATEILEQLPQKIEVELSCNILKNAMGVGIPSTGMIGLPIAIAMGAIVGKSEYGLEVLRDVTPRSVELGRRYIDEKRIFINLNEEIEEKLYIKVVATTKKHSVTVIVAGGHTTITYIAKDDQVILDAQHSNTEADEKINVELSMRKVYDFAMETPIEELRFILDSLTLNKKAAEIALQGDYGHGVGRSMSGGGFNNIFGDSTFTKMLSYTSAACDARMAGALIPVMSNSGSGNQGISATLPVVVYAEDHNVGETATIRALILSHLTVIYIKESLGRLSALCGCVVAATGSSCGITYLMGGDYTQITHAVKNMIANLAGIICDGAKPSCALKVMSGVSTAILSAALAIQNRCVSSVEGIIDKDVDQSIHNLTTIARDGMDETDRLVLNIMTNKKC